MLSAKSTCPGCEKFTALAGAYQVIINHCNTATFILFNLAAKCDTFLSIPFHMGGKKIISLPKNMPALSTTSQEETKPIPSLTLYGITSLEQTTEA